jgi:uncharacterized protein (TIGR02186 family)
MRTDRGRGLVAAVLAVTLVALPRTSGADLVAALSNSLVAITTGFSGTNVLLFGTTRGEGAVVVAVRGPERNEVVRRKGRTFGIWINEKEMSFQHVPAFYALAASQPIDEVVPKAAAARHQIGVDHVRLQPVNPKDTGAELKTFRDALIRNKQRLGLYSIAPAPITFIGGTLFRADMYIPANAPVGTYSVNIFLVRDGYVVAAESTPLIVSKVGFEARMYDFAHRWAPAYGLLAIVVAVVAGWLANLVFRKE